MLAELRIENLGVIEQATLYFPAGLTALTGETGAGKTMLVEAISLLVGGRADAAMVRSGAEEARVDGRLVTEPSDGSGPTEVILSRVIPADGRSRAYVDGRPATVTQLGELTAGVIDLHGQHAHQSLLSVATQRAALDQYGDVDLGPRRSARARLTEIDAELAALGGDERARAREIDLLRFQVAELDAADITDADEDERLAAEAAVLADANAHREAGEIAVAALRGAEGDADPLADALAAVRDRVPYEAIAARLDGVIAEVDDIVAELRSISEGIDEDPGRLDEIRIRRGVLADLRRKYGDDLAAVMEFHRTTAGRLAELEDYDARAAALDIQRSAALEALEEAERAVGAARELAAPRLAHAVEGHLTALAMPNASIAIAFGDDPSDLAHDQVAFLLSANPGSPMLPLTKVASGGELARAMLALRLVLVERRHAESVGTLVFDEVDAGIGGNAAAAVGDALASLGDHHQVLVVTHLAQVAARADQQLQITKAVVGDNTFTSVAPVAGDERVDELARMLAGDTTDAARSHAAELLHQSAHSSTAESRSELGE